MTDKEASFAGPNETAPEPDAPRPSKTDADTSGPSTGPEGEFEAFSP
jgi:hypothetical protein